MTIQAQVKPYTDITTPRRTLSPVARQCTGEALFAMGDIGPAELVKGEIIPLMPTGTLHGIIELAIASLLRAFVLQHKLGHVLSGEVGVYTHHDPDTVRGMDVAYVSHERLARSRSQGYLDVAPELVVEVLSPHDRWIDIYDKLQEYFAIGVQAVWIVDPKHQQIHVYRSLSESVTLGIEDTLTGGEVLSEFSVPVAEVFSDRPKL